MINFYKGPELRFARFAKLKDINGHNDMWQETISKKWIRGNLTFKAVGRHGKIEAGGSS
jgi:hypothetical protein